MRECERSLCKASDAREGDGEVSRRVFEAYERVREVPYTPYEASLGFISLLHPAPALIDRAFIKSFNGWLPNDLGGISKSQKVS